MSKKLIGIICGGFSSEKEISIKSGYTVFNNISKNLWDSYLIVIEKNNWKVIDRNENEYDFSIGDFSFYKNGNKIKFDVIFNAVHGSPGENGKISAILELLNIPHTSCNSYSSALTFNKRDCLSILRNHGVLTANFFHLDKGDPINENHIVEKVGLPCFVKANRAGSSFGVYKVFEREHLKASIEKAFIEDSQLILESSIEGREVSVGVYKIDGEIKVLPITEIISENDFFDFSAKYEGKSQEITPANIEESMLSKLIDLSKNIFEILNLNGITRSEFIIVDETPYLLEVNTIPGLTSESIIPKQLESAGISLEDFFNNLIIEAINKT
jgi:D-alanine-D-alanine ligase